MRSLVKNIYQQFLLLMKRLLLQKGSKMLLATQTDQKHIRVMCWVHAIRKIDAQLNRTKSQKNKEEMRDDIFKV